MANAAADNAIELMLSAVPVARPSSAIHPARLGKTKARAIEASPTPIANLELVMAQSRTGIILSLVNP